MDFAFCGRNRRVDVALELLDRHREVVLGRRYFSNRRRCDLVHVHVRRLRGEHHRDEELEIGAESEGRSRLRVLGGESVDDRADTLAPPRAEPATSLADVATSHGCDSKYSVVAIGSEDRGAARAACSGNGHTMTWIAATQASTS
jgi:hypothetical protein